MRKLSAYDLKSFYNGLKGRIIRSVVRQKINAIWPDLKSQSTLMRVMGVGYALPYLKPYLDNTERAFAVMPAQLGVHDWPAQADNLVCMSAEDALPLETNSVDRIILIHALEFSDQPEQNFAELWRVLKSTGRILIIVPNRMGLWARADWNPFGQGQPYSTRQIEHFLSENLFSHEGTHHALFSPPFESAFLLRGAHFFEKIGPYLYPALGGVSIIEASKQLYAGKGKLAKAKQRVSVSKPATINSPVPTRRVEDV